MFGKCLACSKHSINGSQDEDDDGGGGDADENIGQLEGYICARPIIYSAVIFGVRLDH